MYKPLILIVLLISSSFAVLDASSVDVSMEEGGENDEEKPRQTAINYRPYKEVATVTIDEKNAITNVSFSLLSKDNQDFRIPDNFERKILDIEMIKSIVYTNEEDCAPGVGDYTCILINISNSQLRDISNFKERQKAVREIGDSIIDDLNQVLDINAKFHSVAAQTKNEAGFSSDVMISAVYTIYKLPAEQLYNIFILKNLSDEIRIAGGFFNHSKKLSLDENSIFRFSMSPEPKRILYSLSISLPTFDNEIDLNNLDPLSLFHEDKLDRSKLFRHGFFPLNSILNVIVFSEEELEVKKTSSQIVQSLSDTAQLQKNAWYIVSDELGPNNEIKKLDVRYLFGETNSVGKRELLLSIGPIPNQNGGGCLIATAAFGSELAPQVQFLREIRDNIVLQTESGSSFISGFNNIYYSFSPAIADYERENPAFKETVKLTLTPLLTSLTLLQYVDINSESNMLGYGIGIILLNIGIYLVAPTILIIKIKKLVQNNHFLKN